MFSRPTVEKIKILILFKRKINGDTVFFSIKNKKNNIYDQIGLMINNRDVEWDTPDHRRSYQFDACIKIELVCPNYFYQIDRNMGGVLKRIHPHPQVLVRYIITSVQRVIANCAISESVYDDKDDT